MIESDERRSRSTNEESVVVVVVLDVLFPDDDHRIALLEMIARPVPEDSREGGAYNWSTVFTS
jgi:hypothetical protein